MRCIFSAVQITPEHLKNMRRWILFVVALLLLGSTTTQFVWATPTLQETDTAERTPSAVDAYRLAVGDVYPDDLYVAAEEVYIEGTVEGDLIAAGAYIEISGVVKGDIMAAGGGVVLSGAAQDDVRLAGGGVTVSGEVGDDLVVAGGGGSPFAQFSTLWMDARSVPQGVNLVASARVEGDAYIAGGSGTIDGRIGGDLRGAMGQITLAGRVDGDAELYGQQVDIREASRVGGTLRYASSTENPTARTVAPAVEYLAPEAEAEVTASSQLWRIVSWLLRTLLILIGLAIVAWLLLSFQPQLLMGPVDAINRQPVEAGVYGFIVAAVTVPVSAALIFLAVLFWGAFPAGVVTFMFLFGALSLLWIFSPLVTGLWLGRKVAALFDRPMAALPSLLVGVIGITLAARLLTVIPCLGGLAFFIIYLFSFAFAIGGWILARRTGSQALIETEGGYGNL